jgi:hypothetical protein
VAESCVLIFLSPIFILVCWLVYVKLFCVVLLLFESFCSLYCSVVSALVVCVGLLQLLDSNFVIIIPPFSQTYLIPYTSSTNINLFFCCRIILFQHCYCNNNLSLYISVTDPYLVICHNFCTSRHRKTLNFVWRTENTTLRIRMETVVCTLLVLCWHVFVSVEGADICWIFGYVLYLFK